MDEEKAFMKPLPAQRYELATWNPNIKVGTGYLVSDGRNKYAVPFDLIGEKVDIRLTSSTVEVFFHGSRVAAHVRKPSVQREPIVNENHMAPEQRKTSLYKACMGLLKMADKYTSERLDFCLYESIDVYTASISEEYTSDSSLWSGQGILNCFRQYKNKNRDPISGNHNGAAYISFCCMLYIVERIVFMQTQNRMNPKTNQTVVYQIMHKDRLTAEVSPAEKP